MLDKGIYNPHKVKRGFGRLFGSKVRSKSGVRSRKRDFSPRDEETPIRSVKGRLHKMKRTVEIVLLVFFCLSTLGLLFFHPFFHVEQIEANNLQRIDQTEFVSAVEGILDYNKLYVLPGNNFFLVNLDEVRDILLQRYPLSSIVVQKKFPNKLSIVVEEKLSNILYTNGDMYAYASLDGNVVELVRKTADHEFRQVVQHVVTTTMVTSTMELALYEEGSSSTLLQNKPFFVTSTIPVTSTVYSPNISSLRLEMGDYPLVFDANQSSVTLNEKVLQEGSVRGVLAWFQHLRSYTDVPFAYVILESDIGSATIRTREGWQLRVFLNTDLERQFRQLAFLLADQELDRTTLQYIDLRFQDRVYWY